jgi:hypothetical protein
MASRAANKEKKRAVVAAGIIAEAPVGAIAAAANCSRRQVNRLTAEDDTRALVAEMLRPYRARLARLVPKAIAAIERGLVAQKTTRSDLAVQLIAARRVKDFLILAQPPPAEKAADTGGAFGEVTYEEFQIMFRVVKEANDAPAA